MQQIIKPNHHFIFMIKRVNGNYSKDDTDTMLNRFLGLEKVFNSKDITVNETNKPKAIMNDSLMLNKEDKKINVHTEIIICGMVITLVKAS